MYMTSLEMMWGYLHDQSNCVDEYLFVTDPYRYTSNFVDMVVRNPEAVPELICKIKREKDHSGIIGLLLRNGYGVSELRIKKMMKIKTFHDFLSNEFSELCLCDQDSRKL